MPLELYERISWMECGHPRIFLLAWALFCGSCVTCSRAKHYWCTQGCSCWFHPHAVIAFGTSLVAGFTTDMMSTGASLSLWTAVLSNQQVVHTVKGSAFEPTEKHRAVSSSGGRRRPTFHLGNMLKRQYYEKFDDSQGKSDSRWMPQETSTKVHFCWLGLSRFGSKERSSAEWHTFQLCNRGKYPRCKNRGDVTGAVPDKVVDMPVAVQRLVPMVSDSAEICGGVVH